jgi:hypothetical protein
MPSRQHAGASFPLIKQSARQLKGRGLELALICPTASTNPSGKLRV